MSKRWGPRQSPVMAWETGPAGVREQGKHPSGFSRNLGGLPSPAFQESVRGRRTRKPRPPEVRLEREGAKGKARRGYRQANAMSRRDGWQKSERPRSTSAAGEPTQGSPSRGRRAPCHRPLEGNRAGASNLGTVSTRQQRIAELAKQAPQMGFGSRSSAVPVSAAGEGRCAHSVYRLTAKL